jgi:hypothetical protein
MIKGLITAALFAVGGAGAGLVGFLSVNSLDVYRIQYLAAFAPSKPTGCLRSPFEQ